jgi:hypothetical protein
MKQKKGFDRNMCFLAQSAAAMFQKFKGESNNGQSVFVNIGYANNLLNGPAFKFMYESNVISTLSQSRRRPWR